MFRFSVVIIWVLQFSPASNAQTAHWWADYNWSYKVNDKFTFLGDLGHRHEFTENQLSYLIRPLVSYALTSSVSLSGGVSHWQTFKDENQFNEFRIQETVQIKGPTINKFAFSHRFQIEHRFFYNGIDDQLLRARYRLQSVREIPLPQTNKTMYVLTSGELFVTNTNGLRLGDHMERWNLGIGLNLNEYTSLETDLIWQLIRNPALSEPLFLEGHIFRTRIFYTIH